MIKTQQKEIMKTPTNAEIKRVMEYLTKEREIEFIFKGAVFIDYEEIEKTIDMPLRIWRLYQLRRMYSEEEMRLETQEVRDILNLPLLEYFESRVKKL